MSGQQRLTRWRHNLQLAVELVSLALWLAVAALTIVVIGLAIYWIARDYRAFEREHQAARDKTLDRLHKMWDGQ